MAAWSEKTKEQEKRKKQFLQIKVEKKIKKVRMIKWTIEILIFPKWEESFGFKGKKSVLKIFSSFGNKTASINVVFVCLQIHFNARKIALTSQNYFPG